MPNESKVYSGDYFLVLRTVMSVSEVIGAKHVFERRFDCFNENTLIHASNYVNAAIFHCWFVFTRM